MNHDASEPSALNVPAGSWQPLADGATQVNPNGLLSRRRRVTLRARVTVVAGLAITAAVAVGLLVMYRLQISAVDSTIDTQLRTYATQIAQSHTAAGWPTPLPGSSLDGNAEAQVIGPDGRVLAATRTLLGAGAVYQLPDGRTEPVRQKAADGVIPTHIRVIAQRVTVAGQQVTIVTGTGVGLLDSVNEAFWHQLLIGLPVILVLSGLVVWLIVGRSLRPVARIRSAVTAITAEDLSRRVPEPGTADEIGQLARTMNDMLSRLENSSRRQRRFVADASHELRSPLAAIRTTLDVALAHPDTAPWPVIGRRAADQSARLEALIQQLLLLAKADEHSLAGDRHVVDVSALVADGAAEAAERRGLRIDVSTAADAFTFGEPNQLRRLIGNIVDNAGRFATSVVSVSVTTRPAAVFVTVDDDGPGIPAEERDRVFDRFVRLDASRERGSGGAGLGLAIAREIADAHHARITVASSPRGGARFVVELTRAVPPDSEHGGQPD